MPDIGTLKCGRCGCYADGESPTCPGCGDSNFLLPIDSESGTTHMKRPLIRNPNDQLAEEIARIRGRSRAFEIRPQPLDLISKRPEQLINKSNVLLTPHIKGLLLGGCIVLTCGCIALVMIAVEYRFKSESSALHDVQIILNGLGTERNSDHEQIVALSESTPAQLRLIIRHLEMEVTGLLARAKNLGPTSSQTAGDYFLRAAKVCLLISSVAPSYAERAGDAFVAAADSYIAAGEYGSACSAYGEAVAAYELAYTNAAGVGATQLIDRIFFKRDIASRDGIKASALLNKSK